MAEDAKVTAQPGKRKYKLKAGAKMFFGVDENGVPKRVKPGTIVELTPNQAQAWADLIEAV